LRTPRDFVGLNGVSRWVVKPDDGAGAVATRVHTSFDSALADLASRRKGSLATLEPWVEGEPMSLSLLCHAGRTELISINRQCIRVNGDGILSYQGVQINAIAMDDPRAAVLRDTAQRVARAIPRPARLRRPSTSCGTQLRAGGDRSQSGVTVPTSACGGPAAPARAGNRLDVPPSSGRWRVWRDRSVIGWERGRCPVKACCWWRQCARCRAMGLARYGWDSPSDAALASARSRWPRWVAWPTR